MSLLEFRQVSHSFGKQPVLRGISLEVKEGSILGIVGRSGAGKTTLLHIFLGIIEPTKGDVFVQGRKLRSISKAIIGFASQENSFYARLTVEENMRYFGGMYHLSPSFLEKRMAILLQFMKLDSARHMPARKLSGGMKRRLDLALALLHDPKILVLDEPTTGLDILLNESIWQLILQIHRLGKTIIISSHNLQEIEKHCTHVAFLSQGTVVVDGSLRDIKKKYSLEDLFRKVSYAASVSGVPE